MGDVSYLGDVDGMGDIDGAPCCEECAGGLSGMGLNVSTLPTSGITQDCTGLPILDWLKCQANKITSGISTPTVPVYTPPYFPTYPVNTQSPAAPASSMFSTTPNWLPWALGAAAVVLLARRK